LSHLHIVAKIFLISAYTSQRENRWIRNGQALWAV
jgi:hypothetical protein